MSSLAVASPRAVASARTVRMPFVDLLRALGAQAIVWHHLAFYGPLSDIAYPLAPVTIDLLYDYARMAVQIFFVLGGFMTARLTLTSAQLNLVGTLRTIAQRYLRIGVPYVALLLGAIAANAVASRFMTHESISHVPSLTSFGAHLLFLQHLLGHEAITAGIWYLAIDFQLFLLVLLLCVAAYTLCHAAKANDTWAFSFIKATFWGLALLSLWHLNRDGGLDNYAPYFFGAYFGGVLVAWHRAGKLGRWELPLYFVAVAVAVGIDFRPRLLVAAGTTLVLWLAAGTNLLTQWPQGRVPAYLGRTSYSLFLVHFPVCLLVNAVVSSYHVAPGVALLGIVAAWGLSMLTAHVFHRYVETPSLSLQLR